MQIKFNEGQQEAFDDMCKFIENRDNIPDLHRYNYYTLSGKAGTGKTSVAAELIKHYSNRRFIVSAISHKAKEVLASKLTGRNFRAMSVAGLVAMIHDDETGKFVTDPYAKDAPISDADIVIVDEASMIDQQALDFMFRKKLYRTILIFLGDKGQLPPIGNKEEITVKDGFKTKKIKQELKDNNYSPIFFNQYMSTLTVRVRQGEGNPILDHLDYYWDFTLDPKKSLSDLLRDDAENELGKIWYTNDFRKLIKDYAPLYKEAVATRNTNLIKAVTYKNKNKDIINELVREEIFDNPWIYEIGDLLIMMDTYTKDDYKVENSTEFALVNYEKDVVQVDEYTINIIMLNGMYTSWYGKEKEVLVPVIDTTVPNNQERYDRLVKKLFATARGFQKGTSERSNALAQAWAVARMFAKVSYGYAMTAHKSQGSTYDKVLVNLTDMVPATWLHPQERAAMIYTAGTRARNEVVMVNKIWENL